MTTTYSRTDRAAVEEMHVVHRAFRRELPMVPRLVRATREGDVARASLVGNHLRLVLDGLHMHHTGEDAVLWPLLLRRAAPSEDLVRTMQEQHARVEAYAERVDPLVAEWVRTGSAVRGEQLARLVEQLWAALSEHLGLEEQEILPLALEHVTAAEWRSLGDHGKDAKTPAQLPLLFGCVLEDASAEEQVMMLGSLPWIVRLLMRTLGMRRYRRYISRVRAA